MTSLLPLVMLCTAPLAPQDSVGTGHEPSPIPISWEIKFDFLDLRRIEVRSPDTGRVGTYWYMVYTATNTSDRAQHFYPLFQIVTEELRTTESDIGIDPYVFDVIKELHRQTHPYLVHPTKAIGDLPAGADNARESVAIWPQIDLNVNRFTVYVAGLSGEKQFVPNPAYAPSQPETVTGTGPDAKVRERIVNPRFFTLRKTLEIPYTIPGSPATRERNQPQRGHIRWTMR